VASYGGKSRNTTVCFFSPKLGTGSMCFHDRHHQRQYFTAWAIQGGVGLPAWCSTTGTTASGVHATVDLGSAVEQRQRDLCAGTACRLTDGTGRVRDLADAQVSVAGDWPRNAPYIQTVSGNTVSV